MTIFGRGPLISLKSFHPSVIRWCAMHVIHLGLLHVCNGAGMWFGKWFMIFSFEFFFPNVLTSPFYFEGKHLLSHSVMIYSSNIQGKYCWTLAFGGILARRLAIKCMLLTKIFAATVPIIELNVHNQLSLRAR